MWRDDLMAGTYAVSASGTVDRDPWATTTKPLFTHIGLSGILNDPTGKLDPTEAETRVGLTGL